MFPLCVVIPVFEGMNEKLEVVEILDKIQEERLDTLQEQQL